MARISSGDGIMTEKLMEHAIVGQLRGPLSLVSEQRYKIINFN